MEQRVVGGRIDLPRSGIVRQRLVEVSDSIRVQLFVAVGRMRERPQVLLVYRSLVTNLVRVIAALLVGFRCDFRRFNYSALGAQQRLEPDRSRCHADGGNSTNLSKKFASCTRSWGFKFLGFGRASLAHVLVGYFFLFLHVFSL